MPEVKEALMPCYVIPPGAYTKETLPELSPKAKEIVEKVRERARRESEALRQLAQEPLSKQERDALLEQRRKEFDESWGIDPKSPTDYVSGVSLAESIKKEP